MKIADFCIKHKVTTILAFVMIVIFGAASFGALPLALMPNIELPMAIVMTTYAGAGPEEIENLVTKPIESACASVAGMDELQSQSSENMSIVMVTFTDGTDMDQALVDMREKIDLAKASLPDDASAPTVMKMDIDSMPVVMIGLKGNDLAQMQSVADDDIAPRLERIDGVASVNVMGGYENEVAIETYNDRLEGYGLSVSYIGQMLGADNVAMPAGEVQNGTQKLSVRADGEYKSVEDVENTLIPLPAGGTVRLGEIAKVSMSAKDQDAIAKVDGEPCLLVSVSKQSGVNTVQVAERALKAMERLAEENPTLNYSVLMNQSDYINKTVDSVIQNIIFGVVFAALVLLVFLRDLGSTAVISVSMPVCIVSVFLIMRALNITLNMMSLGGMAMGVGMIVDNSIVVLENIFRFRSDGFSRWDSCTKGAAEVSLSITASTLTTIAVFLPLGLSGGMAGMMFKEFCITIVALLTASLLIALTLVPLLCYLTMDRGKRRLRVANDAGDLGDKPLMRKYKGLLKLFITKRKIAVITSIAMIAVFIVSIGAAGMELIPEMDQGQITVSVGMPIGAEMEETEAIEDRIASIAEKTIPEMDTLYYSTGGSGLMSGGSSVTIMLVDLKDRKRSATEIANELRDNLKDIAGCELSVETASSMGSMSGAAISLSLSGNDYDELVQAGDDLVDRISALPDAVEVTSSAADEEPRISVKVNRENATRFGLTAATIGSAVRGQINGSTATTMKIGGEEYDITVRGDETSKASLDALKALMVPTQTGGSVPLSLVADISTELAPQTIVRDNQSRTITVTGDSLSGDAVTLNQDVQKILDEYQMPDSVSIESGGEMADMEESFGTLGFALVVALGLVYFVLASQFESFIMPVVIMMILPIGLLGAMFGLPVTGNKISMVSIIGVIILAGTVVNSSIVLIDYIQTRRGRGEDKNTAILNACPRRVRPVLMTTLTTILGLLPMAFSGGEGSEMMRPMAIVMITGMIISTIVTLLFTPVYYSLIDSLTARFQRKHPPQDPHDDIPGAQLPEEVAAP
ncbi:MAG: efflux RND transporter permease subunit [Butyricicoccus pullicaecorum]|nr:efflux RND transporter permease subunit [Butyricicoccus pullicaecorum]